MTGVVFPNLKNERALKIHFESGATEDRTQYVLRVPERDNLRFLINRETLFHSPRVTFVRKESIAEVVVVFPSVFMDQLGRKSSFAVIFDTNHPIMTDLQDLKMKHSPYERDFQHALNFFEANLEKIRKAVTKSLKYVDFGELPNFYTPVKTNEKKKTRHKILILAFCVLAVICLAMSLFNLEKDDPLLDIKSISPKSSGP